MIHTKRLITLPERHANVVATIAQRVANRMPQVIDVAAALNPPTLRATGPRTGGRNADHPDPTAGIVLAHVGGIDDEEDPHSRDRTAFDDLAEATAAALEQLKWIEQQQLRYLREHPDYAIAKTDDLKGLCTTPGCDFRAERRGLCWRHYRESLGLVHTPDQHNHPPSTPTVLEHATVDTCAPTKPLGSGATIAAATAWCSTCRRDYEIPHGADPATWLLDHRAKCKGGE